MKRSWRRWFLPHKKHQRAQLLTPRGFLTLSLSVSLIYLIVLASLHIPGLKNVLGYASDITVVEVLVATNNQRNREGIGELQLNPQLSQAALIKAQDMLAHQYWSHNTPEGKEPWSFIDAVGYRYQVAGENLARNFSHTDDMVQAWIASPPHRANLLSDRYTETGIAVLQGEMEGVPTTLVVQMFGTPQKAIADISDTAETDTPSPNLEAEEPSSIAEEETALKDATAPLPRQPLPADQEALLGIESQTQPALISQGNALTAPQQPLLSPLVLFRTSAFALTVGVIFVLLYDLRFAQKNRRSTQTGKHLAHILLLLAVLLSLGFAQTGRLL